MYNFENNGGKMVVVDPVLAGGIVNPLITDHAEWHAIKPATNSFFALGMVRWIIENEAYDATFAALPNPTAGVEAGYGGCSDFPRLVIVQEGHEKNGKLLQAEDAGIEAPVQDLKEGEKPKPVYVVMGIDGQPALADTATEADHEFEGEINGIRVKSVFKLLETSAMALTMEEYSEACGIPVETIERIAKEFTDAAPKAAVANLGGTAVANGVDSAFVETALGALVGNAFMKGGMTPRRVGGKTSTDGERYLLGTIEGKPQNPAKTNIARGKMNYEQTSEFKARKEAGENPYPPKLPWFGLAGGVDNQALFGVVNQYPYQAKILMSWMVNTLQVSSGAMREQVTALLADPEVVPLAITCDVFMGEHATFSDYIVPDTTPFESFGVVTQEGYFHGKGNTVRWPVLTPKTEEFSSGDHASYEAFICEIARRLDVPGFGEGALKSTDGTAYDFDNAADIFLKAIANLAYDTEPVADISEEEMEIQGLDQLPEGWKSKVSEEEWPKVLAVLSRGGRYWPQDIIWDEKERSSFLAPHIYTLYSEKRAATTNAHTGEKWSGIMQATPELMSDGTPLRDEFPVSEWPLASVNYKPRFRSASMLANSKLMQDLSETNYIELNPKDAEAAGVKDGDIIKVENPTGDIMEGPAMVRDGVAEGTFAMVFGYGHIAYGSQDLDIDGEKVEGDTNVAAGMHLETMLDPTVEGVYALADPEASSPARSGGVYRIVQA